MEKARIIGVIAAALMLTGCGAQTDAPTNDAAPVESSAPVETNAPEPDVTPEPLIAETAAPKDDDADTIFLAYVRAELPPKTSIPNATDEQLIDAGHDACAQIAAGTPYEDVRVVQGEIPAPSGSYLDTSAIMNGAVTAYCPEG